MTVATKPRARRIAADEAHSWARNLRLHNPYAKLVLSMLTIYVNGEGVCFVGIEELSLDTELSTDTVRKRLAWLETIGAIARFPQWIDASGRRNGDGNGKRTTDEIRLLMSADVDQIERRALGQESESTEAEKNPPSGSDATVSPRPQQGLSPRSQPGLTEGASDPAAPVSPRPALGQPSDSGKGLISEPEPESPPKVPPPGGLPAEESGGQASEASEADGEVEGWVEFKTAFEADGEPIAKASLAKQLFAARTVEERGRLRVVARGLIAWRARQRKPSVKPSAQTIIRETDAWDGWAKHAPPDAPPPKTQTKFGIDTAEFKAIALSRAIAGLPALSPHTSEVTFKGDVPTGAPGLAALVTFNPGTFEVDQTGWRLVEMGTQRFGAWANRAREWVGIYPERRRFWLDAEGSVVATIEQAHAIPDERFPAKYWTRRSCDGLLLPPTPDGWPPRKDGTVTTGPP